MSFRLLGTNRPAALAIRAFNVETAAIKDSVRGNVMPGKMRMQWWKDSLAGTTPVDMYERAETVPVHTQPVARTLNLRLLCERWSYIT